MSVVDFDSGTPRAGMTSETEIELKLRADPDGMAVLMASPRLMHASRDGKFRRMHAVYYDTPDFKLYGLGINFRVREEDGRFIQTVKLSGTRAGAMIREEHKVEVPSMMPHIDWLSGSAAIGDLDAIAAADITEMFKTTYDRLATLVTYYGRNGRTSLIEIACDQGTITSRKGDLDVSEVELELLKGDPAALYELAIELHDHYPVHVETRSKADRGHDLVSGRWPSWHKSQKFGLARDITVDRAMAEVFRRRFDDWLANEAAAVDGRDPEGVHQVRVALRRLSSALLTFGPYLPAKQLAWLKTESRWAASSLGPARDLDVFMTDILEPVMAVRRDDRGLLALRHRAEEARAAAYREARGAIASPRYGRFVLEFGLWLETAAWRSGDEGDRPAGLDDHLLPWSAQVLDRQYRKIMKLGRKLKSGTDEQRHELRIAIKKLRYAMEFVPAGFAEKKVKAFRQDLTQLQDGLGHMNDVALTETRLDHLVAEARSGVSLAELNRACGQVLGWCARSALDSQNEILDIWDRLRDRRPFWHQDA